jgi:GAF domain-containing protein
MIPFRSPADPRTASAIAASRRAVERTARQAVPALADFCLVHLVSRGAITGVAAAHGTRDGVRLVRALMRTYRIAPSDPDSAVAYVIRTRRPLLRTAIQMDTAVARRADGRIAELHRLLATRSALVMPIRARDGVLGTLTLCYSHSGRSYARGDMAAAARVAARIASALVPAGPPHGSLGLRPAARNARQGPTGRRRLAARN